MCLCGVSQFSVVGRSGVPDGTSRCPVLGAPRGEAARAKYEEKTQMISKLLGRKLQVLCSVVSLALAGLAAAPAQAGNNSDAVFYELTENMSIDGNTRVGAGSLAGDAKVGTPLCPDVLIALLIQNGLIAGSIPCYVTADGEDRIDLTTGAGTLTARVSVTIEMDNPVDAPEFVVMTGSLSGSMQVMDAKNRLISMWGTWTPETVLGYPASAFGLGPKSFTGKVRLPFVTDEVGNHRKPRRNERAYYLTDDGKLNRVQNKEESLGQATARFELDFANAPLQ